MKKIRLASISLFLLLSFHCLNAQEINTLKSPDGKLQIKIQLTKEGNLSYQLIAEDMPLINHSPLGYVVGANNTIPPSAGL